MSHSHIPQKNATICQHVFRFRVPLHNQNRIDKTRGTKDGYLTSKGLWQCTEQRIIQRHVQSLDVKMDVRDRCPLIGDLAGEIDPGLSVTPGKLDSYVPHALLYTTLHVIEGIRESRINAGQIIELGRNESLPLTRLVARRSPTNTDINIRFSDRMKLIPQEAILLAYSGVQRLVKWNGDTLDMKLPAPSLG